MAKQSTSRAVATVDKNRFDVSAIVPEGLKLGKRLILPLVLISGRDPKAIAVRVESEIVASEAKTDKEKPMATAACTDLETGEQIRLIIPTVLESALKNVPGGYVGRQFFIAQGPKVPGKRYFHFELYEVE